MQSSFSNLKSSSLYKSIVILFLLQFGSMIVFSQNSIISGNWNDVTTWDCVCIPLATSDVFIHHSVTVSNDQEANSVTIINDDPAGLNAALTITGGDMVIGPGGLNVFGTANDFASDLLVQNTATLTVNGNAAFTNQITGNNAAALRLTNDAVFTVNGHFSYDYLPADATTETRTEISVNSNAQFIVTGNVHLFYNTATKNSTLSFLPDQNCSINVAGDFSMTTIECGSSGNRISLNFGSVAGACTSTLVVGGDFNVSNNDTSTPVSALRNTVEFAKDVTASIGGNFNMTCLAPTAFVRSNRVRVIGNSILTVGGDIVFDAVVSSRNDNYLEIGNVATSASELDLNGNVLHVDRTAGTTAITNPRRGTLLTTGLTTISFTGTVPQVIPEVNNSNDYKNIQIDNTSGVPVTLNSAISITLNLEMLNGIIDTTTPNRLSFLDGASSNGGSATSYIINGVTKLGGGNITLPLGDDTRWAPILLANIVGANSNFTAFEANYFASGYTGPTLTDGTFDHISAGEYWTLELVSAPSSGEPIYAPTSTDVTFYWKDACASEIEDVSETPQDLGIAKFNNTTQVWNLLLSDIGAGSEPCGTGTQTGDITVYLGSDISEYTHFTFSGGSQSQNPLPIDLISFEAIYNEGRYVSIIWSTAVEYNTDRFIIEKSLDGKTWTILNEVEAKGFEDEITTYETLDLYPSPGRNYYRLTQYDLNGGFKTFPVILINLDDVPVAELNIFPNPVSDDLYLHTTVPIANSIVCIYDFQGKTVLKKEGLQLGQPLSIDLSAIPKGQYMICLFNGKRLFDGKVITIE